MLIWDECSLVLPDRESLKIVHTGVKYIELDLGDTIVAQTATTRSMVEYFWHCQFLVPDAPPVIPWLVLSWTDYNREGGLIGYVGINVGLGVSFRAFLGKSTQTNNFST